VAAAGYFLLRARHTYPTDVATAAAATDKAGPDADAPPPPAVGEQTQLPLSPQ
jgi:hypothetical protein